MFDDPATEKESKSIRKMQELKEKAYFAASLLSTENLALPESNKIKKKAEKLIRKYLNS